jgi:hypothetical protein
MWRISTDGTNTYISARILRDQSRHSKQRCLWRRNHAASIAPEEGVGRIRVHWEWLLFGSAVDDGLLQATRSALILCRCVIDIGSTLPTPGSGSLIDYLADSWVQSLVWLVRDENGILHRGWRRGADWLLHVFDDSGTQRSVQAIKTSNGLSAYYSKFPVGIRTTYVFARISTITMLTVQFGFDWLFRCFIPAREKHR